jgi:hypothetical protein
VRLLDANGRSRQRLADGWREAGAHSVALDLGRLPVGVYFLRLASHGSTVSTRLLRAP